MPEIEVHELFWDGFEIEPVSVVRHGALPCQVHVCIFDKSEVGFQDKFSVEGENRAAVNVLCGKELFFQSETV